MSNKAKRRLAKVLLILGTALLGWTLFVWISEGLASYPIAKCEVLAEQYQMDAESVAICVERETDPAWSNAVLAFTAGLLLALLPCIAINREVNKQWPDPGEHHFVGF